MIHTPDGTKFPYEIKDQRGRASIYEISGLCGVTVYKPYSSIDKHVLRGKVSEVTVAQAPSPASG